MVNILLVSPQTRDSKGGIAVWTDTFLAYCRKNDIKSDLLNIATIGSRAKQGNSRRNFANEFVRTKRIFANLRKMLRSKDYDVAHINTSCGAFGIIRDYLTAKKIKKRQPDCKIVIHFHCDIQTQASVGYKAYFLKIMLRVADKNLVLNQNNQNYLQKKYAVQGTTIANFIDEAWVRSAPKNIADRIQKAVFVGYIQPEKGAREIYDLAETFPEITFELIGEVRSDVKEWPKPSNVVLAGRKNRPEIMETLDTADIFVFPSHSEGFSIALLESMARGLPCVATAVGANLDMLENCGGVIVPVGDVPAMIAAIHQLQEPQVRQMASDWNVKKVREKYTTNAVLASLAAMYIDMNGKAK